MGAPPMHRFSPRWATVTMSSNSLEDTKRSSSAPSFCRPFFVALPPSCNRREQGRNLAKSKWNDLRGKLQASYCDKALGEFRRDRLR